MITFTQTIDEAKDFLEVIMERFLYHNACKSSREALMAAFMAMDLFQPPVPLSYSPPMSQQITVHYRFTMAQ